MEMDRLKKANELASEIYEIKDLLEHLNTNIHKSRITELAVQCGLLNVDTIKITLTAHFKTKLELLKAEFEAL